MRQRTSSSEYLQEAYEFAKWTNTFQGKNPFPDANSHIFDAIQELSTEKKNEYRCTLLLKGIKKTNG